MQREEGTEGTFRKEGGKCVQDGMKSGQESVSLDEVACKAGCGC